MLLGAPRLIHLAGAHEEATKAFQAWKRRQARYLLHGIR